MGLLSFPPKRIDDIEVGDDPCHLLKLRTPVIAQFDEVMGLLLDGGLIAAYERLREIIVSEDARAAFTAKDAEERSLRIRALFAAHWEDALRAVDDVLFPLLRRNATAVAVILLDTRQNRALLGAGEGRKIPSGEMREWLREEMGADQAVAVALELRNLMSWDLLGEAFRRAWSGSAAPVPPRPVESQSSALA